MNYEEMSDFEINAAVAQFLGGAMGGVKFYGQVVMAWNGQEHSEVDYCNNPPDAWPIILANKIWIQPDMVGDGFWHCYDCESEFSSKHKNPLRAAMIVFLMMQEQSQ